MSAATFDEAALVSLTSRIDARLGSKPSAKEKKTGSFDGGKTKRKASKGTKPVTNAGEQKKQTNPRNHPGSSKAVESRYPIEESLITEIRNLGGTEDDINLIQNIGSDSEIEGQEASADDRRLAKDLRNLVQELGIAKVAADLSSETSSSGTDVEEEDEEDVRSARTNGASKNEPKPGKVLDQKKPAKNASVGKGLLFEPQAEWHDFQLPDTPTASKSKSHSIETLEKLHSYASSLLRDENDAFQNQNRDSSARQFYSTIMTSGTLSDKISAMTLNVQESPVHNMRALENLIALAKKRSRSQAIEVLTALKDLLSAGSLLPGDRRLNTFVTQPGLKSVSDKELKSWKEGNPLPRPLQKIHLLIWAYEDWLKSKYFEILQVIETWCNDEIAFSRSKAVDIVYELLKEKPEQEANLLRLLVNKLGDREKKIASRASHNILQLQIPHPLMKPVIISAIESDILFRSGQSLHAKYYAIITLNQTVLSSKEDAVVQRVLDIYFSFFVKLLHIIGTEVKDVTTDKSKHEQKGTKGKKPGAKGKGGKDPKDESEDEQLREKIMSALLTGINRAVPYADTQNEFFEHHLDTLFKITHSSNFNTSIQALMLLQQLTTHHPGALDRFYRTLYESLLDPRLLTTSKHLLYLNLLYKSLKSDLSIKRVQAFVKRLLQICSLQQPPFICGVLFLLRELESTFPVLPSFMDDPEAKDDEGLESFHDADRQGSLPEDTLEAETQHHIAKYDGKKRAPEFSHADKSCLWELSPFLAHFHPSVALFAAKLLEHEPLPSKPDLDIHTLAHFLDKFVYRNPKKNAGQMHGTSIMQPSAATESSSLLIAPKQSLTKRPVNTEAFTNLSEDKVDANEVFFHKYFNAKARGHETAKKKKEKRKAKSDSSDEDESGEDEIWKALVDSRPEIEGPDDDESVGFEDYSDDEISDLGKPESLDGESFDEGSGLDLDDEDGIMESDDDIMDEDMHADEGEPVSLEKEPLNQRASKRRKLKNLPTFASADDYAALLANDEGDQA